MLTQQQQHQHQHYPFHKQYFYGESSLHSPRSRSSSAVPSSSSWSWHPIQSSPSEDLWELPASASSSSSFSYDREDRDDFATTGLELHQEFSIYRDYEEDEDDDDDHNGHRQGHMDEPIRMPPSVTVRSAPYGYDHQRRYSSSSASSSLSTSSSSRNTSGRRSMSLGGKKCVLGDATNTVRRRSDPSSVRRIQRSYFN